MSLWYHFITLYQVQIQLLLGILAHIANILSLPPFIIYNNHQLQVYVFYHVLSTIYSEVKLNFSLG